MEAKDTVMNKEEAAKIFQVPMIDPFFDKEIEDYWWQLTGKGLKAQAEISFKAGYKQAAKSCLDTTPQVYQEGRKVGIKKVVDWIEQYHMKVLEGDPSDVPAIYSDCGYHIPTNIFQAQLQAWGIKED